MRASSRARSSSASVPLPSARRCGAGWRRTRARSRTPSAPASRRSSMRAANAPTSAFPRQPVPTRDPGWWKRWARSSRGRSLRRFDGAVAVVTGGGQGIGAAIANALAAEGAAIVVAARRTDRIERVASEIRGRGGKAWAVHCDVTDAASVADLAKASTRHAGSVDILVNNAGLAHSAPLVKTTLEDWNRVLAVNATGTFLCTRAFLSRMLERKRGSIVNVASVAGLAGGRYIAAYAAAKHAVVGLTRSVAAGIEGKGGRCNAVGPGFVDTEMTKESVERVVTKTGKDPDAALSALLASASQGRLITPDEVAAAVLTLADLHGQRVNGTAVTIAG